jgi:hypothetical protein
MDVSMGNPKHETLNPKQIQMTKIQNQKQIREPGISYISMSLEFTVLNIGALDFGIV